MDVASITSGASKAAKSSASLAGDFETFLTLLTTQLQQQDPLSPMDTDKFTSQLVQFSSVEQAIQTNKLLSDMLASTSSRSLGEALQFVGREVEFEGNTLTLDGNGGGGAFNLVLDQPAAKATLAITDANGRVVRTLEAPREAGLHELSWDGLAGDGNPLSPGTYKVEAKAFNPDGKEIPQTIYAFGVVDGIETLDGLPTLIVDGRSVPLDEVRAARIAQAI